ncbi:VIT family protein [Helicosporidium sp. ATCC 50920]|nr:VIT family protein [Helicosporidium sp. ATCC 50920]|eukprot:KDD73388.1 VIT family protein [Helicosporidium sp. ATCC 50920]
MTAPFATTTNDGLVSVASVLVGVGAGSQSLDTVRLSGVAALVGGALSMAVGEYISVSSQRDAELADIEQERQEQLKGPEAQERELEELAHIYVERGLPYPLARQVAEVLTEKDVVRAHARDELGIDIDDLAQPFRAAAVSATCFVSGGGLPLLATAFVTNPQARLMVTLAATTAGLFAFGLVGALLGGAGALRGAGRVLLGGWLALAVVYLVGALVGAEK